jgi:hypothetical protein
MIRRSFIFLEGIDKKTEQNLWNQGIRDWDSFLSAKSIKGISSARKLYYDRQILRARKALYNFDSSYFVGLLPQSEYWRLYDFFKDEALFLDIETTGLREKDDVTVFGLFDGIDTKIMIDGINLDIRSLRKELWRCKLLVTFNGSSFDVPFIRKRYAGLIPNVPNLDLKSVARKLNLRGSLKQIEKKLGIARSSAVEKLCGGDALALWRIYRATGDDYYLNLLVEYNEEDVINLKAIAEYCVRELSRMVGGL